MGNCQAAEVATVVIQHPDGKVEHVYWSVTASRVMAENPGHYVAVIITAPAYSADNNATNNNVARNKYNGTRRDDSGKDRHAPVKHLKLLRPDDTLLMGHVYRLVSFEEVVRKFETKRHAKLSKLVTNSSRMEISPSSTDGKREIRKDSGNATKEESEKNQVEAICDKNNEDEDEETDELVSMAQSLILAGNNNRLSGRSGQWRPALQTIVEVVGT